jgi:hypothetical protein
MEVWGESRRRKEILKEEQSSERHIGSVKGYRALDLGQAYGRPGDQEMNRTEHMSARCSQSKQEVHLNASSKNQHK